MVGGGTNRQTLCMCLCGRRKKRGLGYYRRVDVEDDVNGVENVVRWSEFGGIWADGRMGTCSLRPTLRFL